MLANKNELTIIGTLVENKLEEKVAEKTGKTYINGSVVVKVGQDLHEVRVFAFEQKNDGSASKTFPIWKNVGKFLNQKVRIVGSLAENRYWNTRTNQVSTSQQLNGSFISVASATAEDKATIKLQGFVVSELTERANNEGKIYVYELQVGQSYARADGTVSPSRFTLHVKPEQVDLIKGVQKLYTQDKTIEVEATLETEIVQVSNGNAAFGQISSESRTYRFTKITGGYEPIVDDSTYKNADIEAWVSAYNERDVQIAEEGKNKADSGKTPVIGGAANTAPAKTQRTTRLLNI